MEIELQRNVTQYYCCLIWARPRTLCFGSRSRYLDQFARSPIHVLECVYIVMAESDNDVRMCGESSCNVFLLLFMVLWVPISAMLCKRAVLMLWHAFMFLGLRLFPLFFFLLAWWLVLLFLVSIFYIWRNP
jgi:hypothetical protein